jgi:hypothetical protein
MSLTTVEQLKTVIVVGLNQSYIGFTFGVNQQLLPMHSICSVSPHSFRSDITAHSDFVRGTFSV